MNSQSIKDKLRSIVEKKSIDFNILLREYMYERFIKRLSVSKFRLNFILKGGYYLSTVFGVYNRATMDIDASLKNTDLSKENLLDIVSEIINIDIGDGAVFNIDCISFIRDEDEYGGYRITLTVKIDSMTETFHFDVATGDPITPSEISYKYKSIIDGSYIKVLAYNLETVLAEKLETIFSRGEKNSRMKDYFDIYLIMHFKLNEINIDYLKLAINNTFIKREFSGDIVKIFDDIKVSKVLKTRWNSYLKRKHVYNLPYNEVINCIEKIIEFVHKDVFAVSSK